MLRAQVQMILQQLPEQLSGIDLQPLLQLTVAQAPACSPSSQLSTVSNRSREPVNAAGCAASDAVVAMLSPVVAAAGQ